VYTSILTEVGKLVERISKFQAKRVYIIMNSRSISHGSTKDVRNYQIEGNQPNCNSYRISAKLMGIIRIMQYVKLAYISGTKRTNTWKTTLTGLGHKVRTRTFETY
jgi:hypothetical protein